MVEFGPVKVEVINNNTAKVEGINNITIMVILQ